MTHNELILQARINQKRSQQYVAMKVGIKYQSVANIEKGSRKLPLKWFNKICEVLKLDKEKLFEAMAADYKTEMIKKIS